MFLVQYGMFVKIIGKKTVCNDTIDGIKLLHLFLNKVQKYNGRVHVVDALIIFRFLCFVQFHESYSPWKWYY